ncbi:MAG TPA: hypothetical protein VHJ38_14070 [Nitrososphaeraceae archaeon]|nr:hypothetical protein [Nitrososphaeraceae archaeon]
MSSDNKIAFINIFGFSLSEYIRRRRNMMTSMKMLKTTEEAAI